MSWKSDVEEHESTRLPHQSPAPGRPGIKPSWGTGAKTAVGTALAGQSRIWFTIASGILNEIYFPDVDTANTRRLRFLVADGRDFFSDEVEDADHVVRWATPNVPVFQISTHCKRRRYAIETEVVTDPARDALLLKVDFQPASQKNNLHLYVTADLHVGDRGENNDAWVGEYKGIRMLFAERNGLTVALASDPPFVEMSCGFLGKSDGYTDIRRHHRMTRFYTEALNGNVAVAAEIDWRARQGQFRLAVAGGGSGAEAGQQARAALLQNFDNVRKAYVEGWQSAHAQYVEFADNPQEPDLYRQSITVMRTHESKRFPGAFVASLSIPWGSSRHDKATGGYHVIWPRDMVETSLGLLACGDADSARRTLFYLHCTQGGDGNWSQNMWLDGTAHWTSTQMDGTSFSILIADALRRFDQLQNYNAWPMVQAAASYLVQNGPVTQQDRWESNAGYSPYTMAVEIAALLAAADFADNESQHELAEFFRATADAWNDAIDELTYATATRLAKKYGVEGYYFRILPPEGIHMPSKKQAIAPLKNQPAARRRHSAVEIVSPDALALVRFGLRSADDPRIENTVHVIDSTLKTNTSTGPVWHRYTGDGYGEHRDGTPFDGTGVGRGWPLLAGERAHYEIARGRFDAAEQLKAVIEAQTSECGMIPEQVWDSRDIPKRKLFNGHPSGSGMPLVWAHAEYVKLFRSLRDRQVWNTPPQTVQRYLVERRVSSYQIWTPEQQRAFVSAGKDLRIDSPDALTIRWSVAGRKTHSEINTTDSGVGVRWAVLPIAHEKPGARVRFTLMQLGDTQSKPQTFEVQIR